MPEPLRPVDAARILARAAAIDNRDASATADEVWCAALSQAGLTVADYRECLAAVDAHYAVSTERIMPAHVIAIVREAGRARRERDRTAAVLAIEPDRPTGAAAAAVHARLRKVIEDATAAREARLRTEAAQGTARDHPEAAGE